MGPLDHGISHRLLGIEGTHGYRLPAKWIGPEPNTMTLVFSGIKLPDITYDAFCVRKMILDLAPR